MSFSPDSTSPSNKEKLDFKDTPIPGISEEVRAQIESKNWEEIPILEEISEEPKHLAVVPNIPIKGKAMAWPAFYKTVKLGHENDGKVKGFGPLAQMIEGDIQTSPIIKIRLELQTMLDKAQKLLDSNSDTANLQLVVLDGYRRIDVQAKLFEAHYNRVVLNNPNLPPQAHEDMARRIVSKPPANLEILRKSPPPHSTAGSIDVILVFKDKINITSDYWLSEAMVPFVAQDGGFETMFYEKKLENGQLTPEERKALEYRRILYHVLAKVEFTNYFPEFWHYDFGNQFNAITAGKKEAMYGFAGGIKSDKIIENSEAEESAHAVYEKEHGSKAAQKTRAHFGL